MNFSQIDAPGTTIPELVAQEVEKVRKQIVLAYFPSIEPPTLVDYQAQKTDGTWETVDPTRAVELRGLGRAIQVIVRWKGEPRT